MLSRKRTFCKAKTVRQLLLSQSREIGVLSPIQFPISHRMISKASATSRIKRARKIREIGFWDVKENQKQFFDSLAKKLHIKSPSDWGKVTSQYVKENKGSSLLHMYNNSVSNALRYVYPGNARTFLFLFIVKMLLGNPNGLTSHQLTIKDIGFSKKIRKNYY